jgi:hypothetical protein
VVGVEAKEKSMTSNDLCVRVESVVDDPELLSKTIEEVVSEIVDPVVAGEVFRRLQDPRIKNAIYKSPAVGRWMRENLELIMAAMCPGRPYSGPAIQIEIV